MLAWNVSSKLFTDRLLHLIRSWRHTCLTQHSKCQKMRGPQPLPSRVIEIPTDKAPHTVKLRETRGEIGTYAALSYCWGTCAQIVTTQSTLQEHLAGIKVSTLPVTIQDAIRLCQSLEILYLWVDSLCIVQDDSQDWHHEAAEMASIYGRSALTITTPNNNQCDQTFNIFDRKQSDGAPLPELPWEYHHEGKTARGFVTVRLRVTDARGRPPFPFSNGNTSSNWMTRGWTLQEWLLSSRVLHCGSERVWDCNQTWHTESHLHYLTFGSVTETDNIRDGPASHIFARMARLDPTIRETSPGAHWARLVEDFTSRTLSREMDKMPAIAGLATKFMEHNKARRRGEKYLAGLWYYKVNNTFDDRTFPSSQIPLGLLWRRSDHISLEPPATYRAPSWSWAALDGPVKLFRLDWPLSQIFSKIDKFKAVRTLEVKSARCSYDPPNSCSLVRTGWIIATGPLRPAYIDQSWNAMGSHSLRWSAYNQTLIGLSTHRGREQTPWFGIFDQAPERTGIHYVDDCLYLLHVATVIRDAEDDGAPAFMHHALILEKVGNTNNVDCFRRLGVAWYSPTTKDRTVDWHCRLANDWIDRHMLKDWESCQVCLI